MSNTPCATCNTDTRHVALVCTVCGTKHESNYEARKRVTVRHIVQRRYGHLPQSVFDSYRVINKARKKKNDSYTTAPSGTESIFGKGRARVKA